MHGSIRMTRENGHDRFHGAASRDPGGWRPAGWVRSPSMVDTERYAATFAMLDKDGDGRVSAAEFKELMGQIGVNYTDETAARAIQMMDTDGDGLVTLEELATYMSTPPNEQPEG